MRNKKGQELVTSPLSGCQICSEVVFLFCDPSQNIFEYFQKLQLVIYASYISSCKIPC